MAYEKDITFAIGDPANSELDVIRSTARRINCCDVFWFGVEENLREMRDGPIIDYFEAVKPEEAIRRYEKFLIANPGLRGKYFTKEYEMINKYEALLYDRRTVLVTYWKTDVESGLE